MSGPRQLVRLRDMRLTVANRKLEQAREAVRQAEQAREAADAEAREVHASLVAAREGLCETLSDAATMLALIDRRRFDYAVAHSAYNDRVEDERVRCQEEIVARGVMLQARVRRDTLTDHVKEIERRDARRAEEKADLEAIDARSRP